MASITLDASVAAKWFLDGERDADHARALRRAILSGELTVVVPVIFLYEVAHTLLRAARRRLFDPARLDGAIQALIELELGIQHDPVIAAAGLAIARRLGTSAYDAAYLAVAEAHRATLITADRPLYEAGLAGGFDVAWLGDLPA